MKPPVVPDWDPWFSHWTPFVTLPDLGYQTHVATMNNGPERTEVRLTARRREGGPMTTQGLRLGMLAPGERLIVRDVDARAGDGSPLLCILSQAPVSWLDENPRERPTAAISGWMGMCDDWVEYRRPDGAGGGVLYTGFFFNDPRTARQHSTVVQSPKVWRGPHHDTGLILMNVATWPAHQATAEVSVCLEMGAKSRRTHLRIPPWSADLLQVHSPQPGYGLLVAVSPVVTVVPLGFIRDTRSGALAIDHTMPPGSYHDAWGDTDRRAAWAASLT